MRHRIAHDLDIALAKQAVAHAFDAYKVRFPQNRPTLAWENDRDARIGFEVKGMKIGGTFAVSANAIEVDLDVPFLFRVFKAKAIDIIEREVRIWIDKAKRGEIPAPAAS